MRLPVVLLVVAFAVAAHAEEPPPPVDPLRAAGDKVVAALRAEELRAIERQFDARMRLLYPHERFVDAWSSVRRQAGAMGACDEPAREPVDGFVSLDYPCRFEKAAVLIRVAVDDRAQVAGLLIKPREVADAVALFTSAWPTEAVVAGAAGWPLPATLTLAPKAVRAPAMVFVHDFGPHDRDETTGVNKPFRDLAEGLAANGIVSLRYDKRTFAFDKRLATERPAWTLDDEAVDDAVAALASLGARPEAGPLYLLGLGAGGRLLPRIAAAAAARGIVVAGLVLVSAPASPMADQLFFEMEFLAQMAVPTVTRAALDDLEVRRDNVRKLIDPPAPAAKEAAPSKPAVPTDEGKSTKSGKEPKAPVEVTPVPRSTALPFDLPASAWRDLATYDPVAALLAPPQRPALLLFGGRDFQVPGRELRLWQRRLAARPDTTIVEFPGVNHVMMEGRGALSPADYGRVARVSQDVIERIATWVRTTK